MAYVDTNGPILLPLDGIGGAAGYNATTLDAAEELVVFLLRAPRTGSISKIGWRVGTVSSPVMTLDIGIEQPADAVGAPVATSVASRTLWGANTYGQENMSGASAGVRYTALTAAASVTEGDLIAVTIRASAVTSGSLTVATNISASFVGRNLYQGAYVNSAWALTDRESPVSLFYDGVGPVYTLGANAAFGTASSSSYQQSTNPNRRGCKFKFTFPAKILAIGVWLDQDVDAVLTVYDTDEYTPLATFTFDKDIRSATSNSCNWAYFATPITIAKDVFYRWAVYPNASGTNISLAKFSVANDGAYKGIAACCMGVNLISTTINNEPSSGSHSWTDTDTERYCCVFLIEQLDDGASTGGGGPIMGGMVVR